MARFSWIRELYICLTSCFSVGHDLNAEVREAITRLPESAWVSAISQDGKPVTDHPTRPRKAYVAELTGLLELSGWGQGARLLVRRERAHPGAQLSLIDTDGWRHQAFLTDQQDADLPELDRRHRAHAHVEARIEDSHALGLSKLPFRAYQMNEGLDAARALRTRPPRQRQGTDAHR